MKRLILGDIHGHWYTAYDIYEKEKPEVVILLGDYVDGFKHNKPEDSKECLDKLIELRNSHIEKYGKDSFIMLVGNHDYHYIQGGERYSGYNHGTYLLCSKLLQEMLNENTLQFIYVDRKNKSIYSHAGISNTWYKSEVGKDTQLEEINDKVPAQSYVFTWFGGDMHGDSIYSSPIWIRPFSLGKDQLLVDGEEWRQVVGHTQTEKILDFNVLEFTSFKEHCNMILCDCLPHEYMVETIDDNGIITNIEYKEYERV